MAPTLPKPCTAIRAPSISTPMRRAASDATTNTPRPVASRRPSEPPSVIGFAGHEAGGRLALVHRVRVHHPRHDLLVRVHVRRGDIGIRSDDDADLAGVAARDALEFTTRERTRIDADTALGTAVWHVHRCVLDRHPCGQ